MAHEIIVVDSQTNGEAKELVNKSFPDAHCLEFKNNLGYSKGVNAGIKASVGDFIFITQPDVVVKEGSIVAMLNYLKENKSVGLVGPRLLNFDDTIQKSYFKFYTLPVILYRRTLLGKLWFGKKSLNEFHYSEKLNENNTANQPVKVDWLMGAALMTKRSAIAKVGGMDERFFLYFEDVDWAKRFWQNNLSVVYFPEAQMYHWHMRGSKSFAGLLDPLINKQTRIHIKSAIQYFWKWRNLSSTKLKPSF